MTVTCAQAALQEAIQTGQQIDLTEQPNDAELAAATARIEREETEESPRKANAARSASPAVASGSSAAVVSLYLILNCELGSLLHPQPAGLIRQPEYLDCMHTTGHVDGEVACITVEAIMQSELLTAQDAAKAELAAADAALTELQNGKEDGCVLGPWIHDRMSGLQWTGTYAPVLSFSVVVHCLLVAVRHGVAVIVTAIESPTRMTRFGPRFCRRPRKRRRTLTRPVICLDSDDDECGKVVMMESQEDGEVRLCSVPCYVHPCHLPTLLMM